MLTIDIIGTKGIPNAYGGFEAFAQEISQRFVANGHRVSVYQPHFSIQELDPFNGVNRIAIKTSRFFPKNLHRLQYNLSSVYRAYRRNSDVIICCGHSPALFFPLFPRDFRKRLLVNMDGLEWKRQKWGWAARTLLKLTERMATKYAGKLIADSRAIQLYIKEQYRKESTYIAYGSKLPTLEPNPTLLSDFGVKPGEYGLLIARFEPENLIEQAVIAFISMGKKLVVVGGIDTPYAQRITRKFSSHPGIVFAGANYNQTALFALRHYCRVYFHGHSVGGTNPSLLDAMATGCAIVAHNNPFNVETLSSGGLCFDCDETLEKAISKLWYANRKSLDRLAELNRNRIEKHYSWELVTSRYQELF